MKFQNNVMFRVVMALGLVIVISAPIAADGPEQVNGRKTAQALESNNQTSVLRAVQAWVKDPAAKRIELPPATETVVVNMKAVSGAPPAGKGSPPFAHIQGLRFQYQPDVGDGIPYRANARVQVPEQIPVPIGQEEAKAVNAVGDTVVSFDGLANTGWIPPDTILAVGPDHIVEATNSGFAVYSRFGTEMQAYTTFANFVPPPPAPWAGYLFDPRIVWSEHHNKWVMLILGKDVSNTGSFHWIMVSQTQDPTGDWWISRFGGFSVGEWFDYASLGVDQWGVYVSGNNFTWAGSFHSSVFTSRNPAMMTGGTNNGFGFTDLRWPNNDQVSSPQIAHPHSTSGTAKTYFVNTYTGSGNQICLWEMSGDRAPGGSNPGSLSKTAMTLSYTYHWLGEAADQPDVADDLDGFDCRVMNAVYALDRVYATFGTDPNNDGSSGGVISVRLNTDTGTKEWDNLIWAQDYYYFFPAITVLGASGTDPNIGLAFSFSHPTNHYGSFATFIYNQAGSDVFLRTADGLASYVSRDNGGRNRWGDYNGAVYDWTCGHLWVAGEYAGTGNTWRTRIAAYNFGGEQPCDRVEVTSPNGGENWPIGSTRSITWQASNPPAGSEFSVQYNWGGLWYELTPPLPSTARSLSWEVTGPETTGGKIYVGMWDGVDWGSFDYSDDFFAVFQPACVPEWPLNCPSDMNSWINSGAGSTDVIEGYSCSSIDYSGNEYTYEFSTATTSQVTVTLTGLSADLDLLVLEGSSCYPNTCIADSTNAGSAAEVLTFVANAGVDYRIVVDGYAGSSSTFTIELSCIDGEIFSDGFENGSTTAWSVTPP